MATTGSKMIMDDLMITNDLVAADPGVTWFEVPAFGTIIVAFNQNVFHLELQFLGAIQLRLAPDPEVQE